MPFIAFFDAGRQTFGIGGIACRRIIDYRKRNRTFIGIACVDQRNRAILIREHLIDIDELINVFLLFVGDPACNIERAYPLAVKIGQILGYRQIQLADLRQILRNVSMPIAPRLRVIVCLDSSSDGLGIAFK